MLRVDCKRSFYRLADLVDPKQLSVIGKVRLCLDDPQRLDVFRMDSVRSVLKCQLIGSIALFFNCATDAIRQSSDPVIVRSRALGDCLVKYRNHVHLLNREKSRDDRRLRHGTGQRYNVDACLQGREGSRYFVVSVLGGQSVRIHALTVNIDIIGNVRDHCLAPDRHADIARAFQVNQRLSLESCRVVNVASCEILLLLA